MSNFSEALAQAIDDRTAIIGIVGLGYVGLPLAVAAARRGFRTLGFEIDEVKVRSLRRGKSHVESLDSSLLELTRGGRFTASSKFNDLSKCDIIIICVPTPLSDGANPDLSHVLSALRVIEDNLRSGQLVVLESTTWPGTTREVVVPTLERGGLRSGKDFFVGYSPEREDPSNPDYDTENIPKIISGEDTEALQLIRAFYDNIVIRTVTVSSTATAEAVKLTENIFRAVNIALANELKTIYEPMGIDIWEVIDAAATKPFGFMPFYPGPGVGGHCIPIDPLYLSWKALQFGVSSRFIELAVQINRSMPSRVISKLAEAISRHRHKSLDRSQVLIVGISYKKNVSDIRESPSLEIFDTLAKIGCNVAFHDPLVASIGRTSNFQGLVGISSVGLELAPTFDAIVIATDHDDIDYKKIALSGCLVVDTRNALSHRSLIPTVLVKA